MFGAGLDRFPAPARPTKSSAEASGSRFEISHNAFNEMVGPPGFEPGDIRLTGSC
jgi:hypothetical protein